VAAGTPHTFVLAVACNQKIPTNGGSARADALAVAAPVSAWKRRSCGDGAKGPRLFDWAVATLPDTGTADHGFTRWLLIRRSIADPTEYAYYLCYGPADTDDEELIRVAGARWAVEECLCATMRLVVSPAQLGGTWREVLGSGWLTRHRKADGDKSMPDNQRSSPGVWGGALGDPRDMAKAGLPEAQSPVDANSHPPERRLKPAPRPAAAMKHNCGNLQVVGRCPTRAFKEMSGPPTSRSTRTTRTNVGSPMGRESYGDAVPVVVAGVTPCQGGRESRPHGRRGTGGRTSQIGRYA
jgi:hypothetical protein